MDLLVHTTSSTCAPNYRWFAHLVAKSSKAFAHSVMEPSLQGPKYRLQIEIIINLSMTLSFEKALHLLIYTSLLQNHGPHTMGLIKQWAKTLIPITKWGALIHPKTHRHCAMNRTSQTLHTPLLQMKSIWPKLDQVGSCPM